MSTIGKTLCGNFVFERYNSHTEVSLRLLKDSLKTLRLPQQDYVYTTVEQPVNCGYSLVVPISNTQDTFFAKRLGKTFLSRFVKANPMSTNLISLELKKLEKINNEWLLLGSHFGPTRAPEIDTSISETTLDQLEFWNSHAYCWGYVAVTPGTVIEVCPW